MAPAGSRSVRLIRNLAVRLRLLRIACGHRYVYDDLARLLPPAAPEISDICGDLDPFAFDREFPASPDPLPDFAEIAPAAAFIRPDLPPWNSESGVAGFLGELIVRRKMRLAVELGCFVGWTSAHLALALRHNGAGRLHCVESVPGLIEVARANLARLGLTDWVEFLAGESLDAAVLARLPAAVDLVFLDTSHQYDATVKEIACYARRLTPQGCLVLHDSIRWGGVRRAVQEAATAFRACTFATEQGNGVTVLLKRP
jgi:predicted O-methyltransferase YrrM